MKTTPSTISNPINGSLLRCALILMPFVLMCVALLPGAQAVSPAPDGGYPGGNTAEGQTALLSLTTGTFNTAIGFLSLRSDTEGQFNTAVGAGALFANVGDQSSGTGVENTATGAAALLNNTTGNQNTATGAFALFSNTEGDFNSANGFDALFSNTTGARNTATGHSALASNSTGTLNTANGSAALAFNTTGNDNTAIGAGALLNNTTGQNNTADGAFALNQNTIGTNNTANGADALTSNTAGGGNVAIGMAALFKNDFGNTNTALGDSALANNIGLASDNTAIGADAGFFATTGGGNVYIGAGMTGVADESQHTYIRNINTTPVSGAGTDTVTVNLTTGLLGHASSSRRYKKDIKPMDNVSEALYGLHPVTFRYNKEIDRTQSLAFGLIAEEVAEVNPDLVARNSQGETESVHYDAVNAMLLNEFLKEHRKVVEQQATITEMKSTLARQQKDFQATAARQQKQIEALTAGLQKVSAQLAAASPSHGGLEASKFATGRIRSGGPAPQVVNNP